jgi:hypothetical protein
VSFKTETFIWNIFLYGEHLKKHEKECHLTACFLEYNAVQLVEIQPTSYQLHVGFLIALLFDPANGGMFL